jgi:hypothetical protein
MRRLFVLALGAAAAAVLVAGAVSGWWRGGGGRVAPPAPLSATAAVMPRSALFGDVLAARVDVLVDRRAVDPASVRVTADLSPYSATGLPTVTRSAAGAASSTA